MKFLMIDNFDSFTYNLVDYFERTGVRMVTVRNNDPRLDEDNFLSQFDAIVLSPGPSNPNHSGKSLDVLGKYYKSRPFFGVCLGMQIINEFFGGRTEKSEVPVHGKVAQIVITERKSPLFQQFPETITVARYHSLYCTDVPQELTITAIYNDIPMAMEHKTFPIYGVQFHPESFMTPDGIQIIANFTGLVYERINKDIS